VKPGETRTLESRRGEALKHYVRPVDCAGQQYPGDATTMTTLVLAPPTTTTGFEGWPERFTALPRIIRIWAEWPAPRTAARDVLAVKLPAHLRDFALAHWHATLCATDADARAEYAILRRDCGDEATAEAWFLVTILRRGLVDAAFAMAAESARRA